MKLSRRKHGSQRSFSSVTLTAMPNFGGSGDATLTFKGDDDIWYVIAPENADDIKTLMSLSHVAHHNYKE